jgi:mannosyltransferase 1 (CAP59)
VGANPHQERVFIAANIVDKDLIKGAWGKALLDLIDIIGPENAFLSIYENDSGSDTKQALEELAAKVKSTINHTFLLYILLTSF